MEVTDGGIMIWRNDVQLLNALSPILWKPLLSTTFTNVVQLQNASWLMAVTDYGMMMWGNEMQKANALCPIVFTPSWSTTSIKDLQL